MAGPVKDRQPSLFGPEPGPEQLGLCCPSCGATEARTSRECLDGVDLMRLACAGCGRLLRHLEMSGPLRFEPAPDDANRAEKAPPGPGWGWIGMVRLSDNVWRAVALADSLGRVWDCLLTYPGTGDRLAIPTRPLAGKES
jgi:hypothetical protein